MRVRYFYSRHYELVITVKEAGPADEVKIHLDLLKYEKQIDNHDLSQSHAYNVDQGQKLKQYFRIRLGTYTNFIPS